MERGDAFTAAQGISGAGNILVRRDVIGEHAGGLDATQLHTLKLVSLCLACVSVASAVLAFYWFIRIRRSFRHDLIMLLIQSDMFKALWFMIFPIVDFTHGPIKSSSTFCQISGFFLTVGIEASDIAVLLIAVHTALYIFQPRGTRGEYGLYPYRRYAVAVLFIVPHLLASLAFINKPDGYTNVGAYCYLPTSPGWPRMALSWIPRYIIFLTILVTYGCIYFYVMFLIRRFGRESTRTSTLDGIGSVGGVGEGGGGARRWGGGGARPLIPPTPPIAYHGLILSSELEPGDRLRQGSVSTIGSLKIDTTSKDWAVATTSPLPQTHVPPMPIAAPLPTPTRHVPAQGDGHIDWKWTDFGGGGGGGPQSSGDGLAPPSPKDMDVCPSPTMATTPARRSSIQEPVPVRTRRTESPDPMVDPRRRDSVPTRSSAWPLGGGANTARGGPATRDRSGSVASIFSVLRQGPPPPPRGARGSYSSTTSSSVLPYYGTTTTTMLMDNSPPMSNMHKTREKIRRQLRLLFIYPLVYLFIWVVPFVSHVFKWDNPDEPGPFGVLVVSLASLCIQGAVNSWLFSTRERPWKYRRRLGNGHRSRGGWSAYGVRGRGSIGRSREEMLVEGRAARRRRDAEIEERRKAVETPRGPNRHWWDVLEASMDSDSSDEELLL